MVPIPYILGIAVAAGTGVLQILSGKSNSGQKGGSKRITRKHATKHMRKSTKRR